MYITLHVTLNLTGWRENGEQEVEEEREPLTKRRGSYGEGGLGDECAVRSQQSQNHCGVLCLEQLAGTDGDWKLRHWCNRKFLNVLLSS